MVSNLVNGDADMITANLDICCQRTNVIDYAWTLSAASKGFGIKSKYTAHCSYIYIQPCAYALHSHARARGLFTAPVYYWQTCAQEGP